MTNRDDLLKRVEAGEHLAGLRRKKGLSLVAVAEKLGISVSYLNEIEKGKKTPADELLRTIAKYYKEDENDLFQRFGKQPLSLTELLKNVPELESALAKMKSDKIPKEEIYDFVAELETVYNKYIRDKK